MWACVAEVCCAHAMLHWLSSRTQNILHAPSLPHIYIIKMRWTHRKVTESTTVKSGPVRAVICSSGQRAVTPILSTAGGERGEMETAGERGGDRWRGVDRHRETQGDDSELCLYINIKLLLCFDIYCPLLWLSDDPFTPPGTSDPVPIFCSHGALIWYVLRTCKQICYGPHSYMEN